MKIMSIQSKTTLENIVSIGNDNIVIFEQQEDIDKDGTFFTGTGVFVTSDENISEASSFYKKNKLDTLTITTSYGNIFDANTQARVDLSTAITASDITGQVETIWRLANNNEVLVSVTELKEALVLALQEYAKVKGIGA
jgi:hypothetical protein